MGWIGWGHAEDPTHGEYSFGYALLPEYWGRGYMTAAARAGLTFMFETLGAHGIVNGHVNWPGVMPSELAALCPSLLVVRLLERTR